MSLIGRPGVVGMVGSAAIPRLKTMHLLRCVLLLPLFSFKSGQLA
jgi:hypothetical protein